MSDPTAAAWLTCMNFWCHAETAILYSLAGWHGGMCPACWARYVRIQDALRSGT